MAIYVIRPKSKEDVGRFLLFDSEKESIVAAHDTTELENEMAMLEKEITRLDIMRDDKKLLAWAQRFYPMSGEGQMSRSNQLFTFCKAPAAATICPKAIPPSLGGTR